jgi:hypothetical protein
MNDVGEESIHTLSRDTAGHINSDEKRHKKDTF